MLIGDPDQLPSVGCGDLLRDVMMADPLEDVRSVLTYLIASRVEARLGLWHAVSSPGRVVAIEALGERFEDCVTIQQVRLRSARRRVRCFERMWMHPV